MQFNGGLGNAAIYAGRVVHVRHRPRQHKLSYDVFSLLLDLDELAQQSRSMRFFGHNRAALFSFWDEDHGNGEVGELKPWIAAQLIEAGLSFENLQVRVLCYPRILGYVFNPLTVYFCHDGGGSLRAVLYEVSNTFHERHTYVIPVEDGQAGSIRQSCAKNLYVSPFVPMACRYDFRIVPPGETTLVAIDESDAEGALLFASFAGKRRAFNDRSLLRIFFEYPLMTLKVTAGIHWEALRLWWKGVPVVRHHKAASRVATTIVSLKSPAPERSRKQG
ncbi:DUF1365 family protein [Pararhizobium capsulatum DSM 1112]|uniref:DUF1365 family protein n=1 Tax=Pararhizobium capsulatum DSM 1112 TaxID=1121113 RepID=A0ABU0BR50_9HYPH|nr:DUF1365 family protein [Pararhizobium capsulatum]MDQ0320733.1 DUF1365 family protein [Pararhizobium capsulatum DSM 1112]